MGTGDLDPMIIINGLRYKNNTINRANEKLNAANFQERAVYVFLGEHMTLKIS